MYKTAKKHKIRREEKVNIVNQFQQEIEMSRGLIITNFEGITAHQIGEIRRNLKKYNSKLKVVNNKLFLLALKNKNLEVLGKFMYGSIGVVFCYNEDDVINVVKYLVDTSSQLDKLKISGGYIFNTIVSSEKIKEIAKLPSKQELIAKSVYLIKSPLVKFIIVLKHPINLLLNILDTKLKEKTN